MQHRLKPASGAARAKIVAAQLLNQFFVTIYDAKSTLYAGFGWESFAALTASLERTT
jgi:hypothetical protein